MIGLRGAILSTLGHLAVAGWLITSATSKSMPETDMAAAEEAITVSLSAAEPAQQAEDAPPPATQKPAEDEPVVAPVPEATASLPEEKPVLDPVPEPTPEPRAEAFTPPPPPEIATAAPVLQSVPDAPQAAEPQPQKLASIDPRPIRHVQEPKLPEPAQKQAVQPVQKKVLQPLHKMAGDGKGSSKPKPASAGSAGRKNQGSGGAAACRSYAAMVLARLRGARPSVSGGGGFVTLSFTISASGGLISAGASGGDAGLKSAALSMVRNAAPFPAIPTDTGKSSWHFTVPVQFN